jgi:hypothetical protein
MDMTRLANTWLITAGLVGWKWNSVLATDTDIFIGETPSKLDQYLSMLLGHH